MIRPIAARTGQTGTRANRSRLSPALSLSCFAHISQPAKPKRPTKTDSACICK